MIWQNICIFSDIFVGEIIQSLAILSHFFGILAQISLRSPILNTFAIQLWGIFSCQQFRLQLDSKEMYANNYLAVPFLNNININIFLDLIF